MTPEKCKKYLKLANVQAELFSKDPNTKVAAIILSQDHHIVLATGYNGIPRHMNDAITERWERPLKYKYVVHAECNAVCNAARSGMSVNNGIVVVTMFPCLDCAKMLIQSGIKTIIAPHPNFLCPRWGESFMFSTKILKEAQVEMLLFNDFELSEP